MQSHFARSLFLVTAASSAAMGGCADDGADPPVDGACATSGSGSIHVTISGLPAGLNGKVTLTGPATLTTGVSNDFLNQAAGRYEISAEPVTSADPVVRVVYVPVLTTTSVCAESGARGTVEVAYRESASSNKLWLTNANNASGELLGFGSSSLRMTGSPAAGVAAKAAGGGALAFDRDGDLWTRGSPGSIARFAAASLGVSGPKVADRTIDVDVGGCAPGITSMSFDKDGALWVTSSCANKVVKLTNQQLTMSGMPAPGVVLSGTTDPQGIAFDAAGNLWITDSTAGTILRYDAARLTASTASAASLAITAHVTATSGAAQLIPSYLAFDAMGALWAIDFGMNVIYKLVPSQLGGAGARDAVPSVQMTIDVAALLESMAFDEGGGLWLTFSQGKVARVDPSQLTQSTGAGSPTVPQMVITSADIGSAVALAFYPSPAALPLYSSVP